MTATILIVDDDPDILDLISALLGEEGFQTAGYSDGLAALQAIRTQRPALAIIDLALPIMDGQELIKRLRQEPGEPVPVIAMSAAIYAPHPDQLQVDAYIAKPFDLEELLAHVNALVYRASKPVEPGVHERSSLLSIRQSMLGSY